MVVVAQVHPLDEPLIVGVLKSVVRKIKIVFRHDAKRPDGGQRAAVFAVELVDSVAINDQLPLVAARPSDPVPRARTITNGSATDLLRRVFTNCGDFARISIALA